MSLWAAKTVPLSPLQHSCKAAAAVAQAQRCALAPPPPPRRVGIVAASYRTGEPPSGRSSYAEGGGADRRDGPAGGASSSRDGSRSGRGGGGRAGARGGSSARGGRDGRRDRDDRGPARGGRGASSGASGRGRGSGGGRSSGGGGGSGFAVDLEAFKRSAAAALGAATGTSASEWVEPPRFEAVGGAWRLYGISVPMWKDPGKDDHSVSDALHEAVCYRLGCPQARMPLAAVKLVRKSFDARKEPPELRGGRPDDRFGGRFGNERSGGRFGSGRFGEDRGGSGRFGDRGGRGRFGDDRGGRGGGRGGGGAAASSNSGSKSWVYVVDVAANAVTLAGVAAEKLVPRPGQVERIGMDDTEEDLAAAAGVAAAAALRKHLRFSGAAAAPPAAEAPPGGAEAIKRSDPVVVVGSGPAGLFAALSLAEGGRRVVLLERGQPVEQRGRDIGALFVRRRLNPDSNLCYGEGGAGTWSDGKLTTRIGRNSDPVRRVLQALVDFGAPEAILVAGKPHLGTDALVRILKRFRAHLQAAGVDVRFGAAVEGLLVQGGRCEGVTLAGGEELRASAVVLAVGHSARPLYRTLAAADVALSAKPFALGFRIEHPQALIDEIQYGAEDAQGVMRGKGRLPVADYTLAAEVMDRLTAPAGGGGSGGWGGGREGRDEVIRAAASQAPGIAPPADGDDADASGESGSPDQQQQQQQEQGEQHEQGQQQQQQQQHAVQGRGQEEGEPDKRGVYSFCMCPGGQVVPTSTSEEELCINGMSFSRRNSVWANAALVVAVRPSDWAHLERQHGPLAGMELQLQYERAGATMGGLGFTAPVQRVTDFLSGDVSRGTLPSSSYRLGVTPGPLHQLYAPPITEALRVALTKFDRRLRGFITEEALLHGVETRTSAPVRIDRDPSSCESVTLRGLFPCGEGAGYAGGIMSAAVDGLRVADAVAQQLPAAQQLLAL